MHEFAVASVSEVKRTPWHIRVGALVIGWLTAALVAGAVAFTHDVSTWLLVHLLFLGALSNAILIWSSHFSAAMLRLPDAGREPVEIARLVLFNVGALLVILGMMRGEVPLWNVVVVGAAFCGIAVLWHAVDLIARMRRALPSRFGDTVRYYVVAALFLPLGIAVGVVLAPDAGSDEASAQMVLAHVSLNLLGWVGLTVLGTIVTLWPTILHTQVADGSERAARRALPILTGSVVVVAVGALTGLRAVAVVGVVGYLVGVVLIGIPRVKECRKAPPSTYAAWSVLAALLWFTGSLIAFGIILALANDWESAADALDHLAGPLLIGFAAQILLGALSFLIPVVLGGGPATARTTNAILGRAGVIRLVAINGGLVVSLLPVGETAHQVAALVVLLGLASFLPLAIASAVVSRKHRQPPTPV